MVTLGVPVPEMVAEPAATDPPLGLARAKPAHAKRPVRTTQFFAIFHGLNPGEFLTFWWFFMDNGGAEC
jgi:hypothetical protein